jgi:hypothetical protein
MLVESDIIAHSVKTRNIKLKFMLPVSKINQETYQRMMNLKIPPCLNEIPKNGKSFPLYNITDKQEQDHYAVLGLSKYRYKATEEQIKKAHRKKALKHHPDKKAGGGNENDDSFFKCIQKGTRISKLR